MSPLRRLEREIELLCGTRDGDETGELQRIGVERRRGFATQPSIAGFDQTIRKVGNRILLGVKGVFD